MYTLRLGLLAVLCVSAVNAGDLIKDINTGYNLIVKDPRGVAATVHYVAKKVSVVDQLPEYVKNNPLANNPIIKKGDIDRALLHVAANVRKAAFQKSGETTIAADSAKDAGISLALSALWNAAEKMGFACYVKPKSDSEVANFVSATVYGFVHSACRVALDAKLQSASAS